MATKDRRVDAYIARAAPFARPVLAHLRSVVHAAVPDVEETIKWGHPFFMRGRVVCWMAAFKAHCGFGFWRQARLAEGLPPRVQGAMGHFGRLTSVKDLPPRRTLAMLVRRAAALVAPAAAATAKGRTSRKGTKASPRGDTRAAPRRAAKPVAVPSALAAALRNDTKARAAFRALAPSHQREYAEWIGEAKREETVARRVATALARLVEGKSRNWKYERSRRT